MTAHTATVTVPASALQRAPRGAAWAASAWVAVARLWRTWINAQPQRAVAQRDRSREANALRDHARGIARHDPRLAADLFAAADRHEMGA